MPPSASTASNNAGNLPSRSRMRYLALDPASSRSMTRFRATCATQEVFGWAVAPRIRIRRVVCSITASTYIRAPLTVTVSRKSQASRASALLTEEVRPGARRPLGCRIDTGLTQGLPDGGRSDLHAQHEPFAVQTSITPIGVFFARRSTRMRMDCSVRGRPGRLGLDAAA